MALKLGELSVLIKADNSDLTKNMGKAKAELDGVGSTAKRDAAIVAMAMKDMNKASREAGGGFDRVGDAADNVDTKAMGFRDTLTGVQDGFAGLKQASSEGLGFESLLLLGFGVGDLASGFYNFLIPSLKSAVTWLKSTKLAALASAAASGVARAATVAWTGVQWLLNAALLANPIGLIILAVVALIAIFVVLWVKFAWFRDFWIAVWEGIKTAALAVWDFIVAAAKKWWETFSGFWKGVGKFFTGLWGGIVDGVKTAWNWITDKFDAVVKFVSGLPKRIGKAAGGMWDGIKNSFKSAVNWIIRKWNDLSFRIPGISVPGLGQVWGGATLSTPNIPMLAKGGHITGAGTALVGERGPELVHLNRGATVQPLAGGGAGGTEVKLTGEFRLRGTDLVVMLREKISLNGGSVQAVLGARY